MIKSSCSCYHIKSWFVSFFSILVRLSERMGDEGKGKLEVFQPSLQSWKPACMTSWDPLTSPKAICSMLGYRLVFINTTVIVCGRKLGWIYHSFPFTLLLLLQNTKSLLDFPFVVDWWNVYTYSRLYHNSIVITFHAHKLFSQRRFHIDHQKIWFVQYFYYFWTY